MLADSLLLCLAGFLTQLRTTCPRNGAAQSGLSPPLSANNRVSPQLCPQVTTVWETPQVTLDCGELMLQITRTQVVSLPTPTIFKFRMVSSSAASGSLPPLALSRELPPHPVHSSSSWVSPQFGLPYSVPKLSLYCKKLVLNWSP